MDDSKESTSKLAEALAKAQGQIKAALKTSANDAFNRAGKKSMYADIAEVIEVIQEPASKNGLSVIFNFKVDPDIGLMIRYHLLHSSGESMISEWIPMFLRDKNLHSFGASNTFMRRQLLKAIYQIPEEDDDGNSQSLGDPKQDQRPAQRPQATKPNTETKPAPKPQSHPEESPQQFPPDDTEKKSTDPEPNPNDPSEFVILFGNTTTGKKIRQIGETDLKNMIKWVEAQLKITPPVSNMSHLFAFKGAAKEFLKSVGVEA